jgi:phage tail sheath gpL-like
MVEQKLKNDEIKNELLDVSVPTELIAKYKGKEGQNVQIKCNYMSKEKVTFYGVV